MLTIIICVSLALLAAGLLILFSPLTDEDKAIQEALAYDQKREAMARAINRDRRDHR